MGDTDQKKGGGGRAGRGGRDSSKYVSLYGADGELAGAAGGRAVRLPGRHECECQAARHPLVANCLHCGRVVCQQEGSGPCFFCGKLVCTAEEREVLDRQSKKSDSLLRHLTNKELPKASATPTAAAASEGLKKALQHKNKLLDYDKSCAKRTQVIDDQSDYYATSNQWMSAEERAQAERREREVAERRAAAASDRIRGAHTVALDFAGRRVVSADDDRELRPSLDEPGVGAGVVGGGGVPVLSPSSAAISLLATSGGTTVDDVLRERDRLDPALRDLQQPTFCSEVIERTAATTATSVPPAHGAGAHHRLQDSELRAQSRDQGMCLSMHQPWASLLLAGLKRHEGRVWYSAHRGVLWIASTAKQPTPQQIRQVEQPYAETCARDGVSLPSQYPVGCLLGKVTVTDCLPEEEYIQLYPDGESGSPYVFICENPQQLMIKFPIKGQHKIFKLDGRIHEAAQKSLEKHQELMQRTAWSSSIEQ